MKAEKLVTGKNMKLQRLYSYVRKALDDYQMVEEGDRIAIGISGGKDSLTLLYALSGLRHFYPKPFEIQAITVDLGYEGFQLDEIQDLCKTLKVDYHIEKTQIKDAVKEGECSLCARLRKGAFMHAVKELHCNKIAYAHNMDDVVETMMLSLIYEGRFSVFYPVTHYGDMGVDLIRPLIYAPVEEIKGFEKRYQLPVKKNPCPYDGHTERTYVRELLRDMNHHAPGVKKRLMTAIRNGNLDGWRNERGESKQDEGTNFSIS